MCYKSNLLLPAGFAAEMDEYWQSEKPKVPKKRGKLGGQFTLQQQYSSICT